MPRFVGRLLGLLLIGPFVAAVGESLALAQELSSPRMPRLVERLKIDLPGKAALGTPFDVEIKFPKDAVSGVAVRQRDGLGHHDSIDDVPVVLGWHGQTVARITPLEMGAVTFDINAAYSDGGISADEFTIEIGPPIAPPRRLFADVNHADNGFPDIILSPGDPAYKLRPVAFFESAPGREVNIDGWATYRLLPSDGPPVVTLAADGTVAPLRHGTAMAEVSFAGATTRFRIKVIR